jgi:predicted transcriptional regulator YdeE
VDIVQIEEKHIRGISVRTKNSDEMSPATAKIGQLYQKFDEDVYVNYKGGARVYGVYYDYESDEAGEYTVLAGSDHAESEKLTLEQVKIPSGKYMVFAGRGEIPQVVIDTWGKIWEYFAREDISHKRTFTTDFEYYKSPDEVEIHIAVK